MSLLADKYDALSMVKDQGSKFVRSGLIGLIVGGWYQCGGNGVVWIVSGVPEFLWGAKDLILLALPRL